MTTMPDNEKQTMGADAREPVSPDPGTPASLQPAATDFTTRGNFTYHDRND